MSTQNEQRHALHRGKVDSTLEALEGAGSNGVGRKRTVVALSLVHLVSRGPPYRDDVVSNALFELKTSPCRRIGI